MCYNTLVKKGRDIMKKVILVTGSSRGIGAATIKELAKNGYNVVINYLNSEKEAEKLKEAVEKEYQVKALTIKGDVSNEEDVKHIVDNVLKVFGKIDVLVNNAGIAFDTTLEDKTVDLFTKTINTNLLGTFLMCKYVGQEMMKNKEGAIINISSTNGIDTYYPFSIDYDASKAGVISLTHNFAVAYAPYVRVNSIAPGWVNTEMNKELDEEFIKEECQRILLDRFAEPEEIAKEVLHLAESSYINNIVIKVDGGRY